jgi:hypothetical protein
VRSIDDHGTQAGNGSAVHRAGDRIASDAADDLPGRARFVGHSLPLIMVVQCGQVSAGTTKVSSFDRPLLSVSTSYAGRSIADVLLTHQSNWPAADQSRCFWSLVIANDLQRGTRVGLLVAWSLVIANGPRSRPDVNFRALVIANDLQRGTRVGLLNAGTRHRGVTRRAWILKGLGDSEEGCPAWPKSRSF